MFNFGFYVYNELQFTFVKAAVFQQIQQVLLRDSASVVSVMLWLR